MTDFSSVNIEGSNDLDICGQISTEILMHQAKSFFRFVPVIFDSFQKGGCTIAYTYYGDTYRIAHSFSPSYPASFSAMLTMSMDKVGTLLTVSSALAFRKAHCPDWINVKTRCDGQNYLLFTIGASRCPSFSGRR
ncbi:MAG TPA: hypothetical protein PKV86_15575 [Syntrophobacteraceae bacterium]|nr:hypothetical protein [Syntrophobacteraceae bacterium]